MKRFTIYVTRARVPRLREYRLSNRRRLLPPDARSQLIVVSDTLNMVTNGGRQKLSVVTNRAPRKRLAVLHFYPYRTRISSYI